MQTPTPTRASGPRNDCAPVAAARTGCAASKVVVVTGGPGGGKTALLEVVQRELWDRAVVVPEAASILWQGGFPRRSSMPARMAGQRAIVRVQLELQRMITEETHPAMIVCDRGTLDGLAYWPGDPECFFTDLGTSRAAELARYATVIHLRTPRLHHGYTHTTNPLRTETAVEAAALDDRILAAWSGHPRRLIVDSRADFVAKLGEALELVRAELPVCSSAHV